MTIQLEIHERNGASRKVSCEATPLKASPNFALHRAYLGDGEWSDTGWKITHIHSGHSLGQTFYGRKGTKAMRCVAAVLERVLPADRVLSFDDFVALRREIKEWAKAVNREYA